IHHAVGANLGSRTAAWLYDRLTTACVRPPGMGHLENPGLISDLTMARDFDLGITGPPLFISMDFIAAGLVELVGGLASAVVLAANVVVLWSLAAAATSGHLGLDRLVTFASAAVSTSMIAFGGLSWALDGAAAPAAAVLRLQEAMASAGALVRGERPAAGMP